MTHLDKVINDLFNMVDDALIDPDSIFINQQTLAQTTDLQHTDITHTTALSSTDQQPTAQTILKIKTTLDSLLANTSQTHHHQLLYLYHLLNIEPPLEITPELHDKFIKASGITIIPHTQPLFTKNEIVGAKDKEGRWWMSQILDIIQYDHHNIYYVSFLGWGDRFNEFITNTSRIKKYNPRRHKYYRPSL